MPAHDISPERKALYYIGMALIGLGFLLFFSVFLTAFSGMSGSSSRRSGPFPADFPVQGGRVTSSSSAPSGLVRAPVGMLMMIAGSIMMKIGARGPAGSGMILSPKRARRDIEPWARMAGGMVKDALEETGLAKGSSRTRPTPPGDTPSEAPSQPDADWEATIRKLHQLWQEGIISEEEYRKRKRAVLEKHL